MGAAFGVIETLVSKSFYHLQKIAQADTLKPLLWSDKQHLRAVLQPNVFYINSSG